MFNIVMVHPEIPHNTGAAGRLALATGSRLHLVKPLGFDIGSSAVKRAGLDYWEDVDLVVWESWEEFQTGLGEGARVFCLTTKAVRAHWEVEFERGDYLLFGGETKGLEPEIRERYEGLRIPMEEGGTRSLNLATAVAIVLYEGCRQCGGFGPR